MATARISSAQRSVTTLITDTRSRQKDTILQCLTRLNDKSTLKVSAEELSAIIRASHLANTTKLSSSSAVRVTLKHLFAVSGSGWAGLYSAEYMQHRDMGAKTVCKEGKSLAYARPVCTILHLHSVHISVQYKHLTPLQECLRALGQLPCSTCPAAEAAIQQPYLGKVLGHLKKNLQVSEAVWTVCLPGIRYMSKILCRKHKIISPADFQC